MKKKTNRKNKLLQVSRTLRVNIVILLIIFLLIILFSVLNPSFLSLRNFLNMGHHMAITAIIAFAMTAVILGKGIDLSVGSTLAVSGVVGGLVYQSTGNALVSLLSIIAVGGIIGALNGFLITNLKISPFIATLGTMALGSGAALSLSNSSSISIDDKTINFIGSTYIGVIPVTIIVMLVLFLAWWVLLNRTTIGRYIYSIGGNFKAAKASGVKVKLIQFLTYVGTGVSASISSIILIGRVQSVQPLGGEGLEFDVITGVIIGGTVLVGGIGSVSGTLFGVMLFILIKTGLSFFGAPQEITYIVTGCMVLLSVIIYSPETIESVKKWRFKSNKHDKKTTTSFNKNNTMRLENIGKNFSGFSALDDIDIEIKSGETVALVGENGAGKSTLVKILSGVIPPSTGNIEVNNQVTEFANPKESRNLGIGVVHQHYSLAPELSITENLFIGREKNIKWLPFLSKKIMENKTKKLLQEFNINISPQIKVNQLTVGEKQLVEVMKAVLGNPWFLIMDEPTSSLSKTESELLYSMIDELKKRNVAILYISHKMDELYKLCNRAVILRDGKLIDTVELSSISEDEIVNKMVGRKVENVFPYVKAKTGKTVLEVNQISDGNLLKNATLKVREGEIVVLAGLMGSGRSEVLNTIFGINKKVSGEIKVNANAINKTTPEKMYKKHGLAYIPEDRHASGFIPDLPVSQNLTLSWIQKNNKLKFIPINTEREKVKETIRKMNVKPPEPNKLVNELSGGNQQKVVLGKWLLTSPNILLLDDPTRGVDVGAKAEIHNIIANLKQQGIATLMVSSELTEALNVGDRIIVMHEGSTVAELSHGATEEQVMHYALGINKKEN